MGFWITEEPINIVELPKGTIYRLYGTNLSFDDEPITDDGEELKIEQEKEKNGLTEKYKPEKML